MPKDDAIIETREEIASEQHRAMIYKNELIKHAAHTVLIVEVKTSKCTGLTDRCHN